jgi:hypothetical protein
MEGLVKKATDIHIIRMLHIVHHATSASPEKCPIAVVRAFQTASEPSPS